MGTGVLDGDLPEKHVGASCTLLLSVKETNSCSFSSNLSGSSLRSDLFCFASLLHICHHIHCSESPIASLMFRLEFVFASQLNDLVGTAIQDVSNVLRSKKYLAVVGHGVSFLGKNNC